jgi:DNA polymerase-3 subunit delta'
VPRVAQGFEAVEEQGPAVETLRFALRSGRVHHAYRFEGPDGVGKEMAALALAQSLVCEAPTPEACGRCSACHRAITLSEQLPQVPLHPDVVFVSRGLYPATTIGASEATTISVEQVRRIVISRCGYPPHEGKALVFLVRNADELSQSAANALLKALEEPPKATYFVLLTSRPNRLPDTVLSRTLRVRFGALSDALIARILSRHNLSTKAASLAQGSASLALELATEEPQQSRAQFVLAAEEALRAKDLGAAIGLADKRPAERDQLRAHLSALAHRFAEEARESVKSAPDGAELAAKRHQVVLEAMVAVESNAQPGLLLEAMITSLREL